MQTHDLYEVRRICDDKAVTLIGPVPLSLTSGVDWETLERECEREGENLLDCKVRIVARNGQLGDWMLGRNGEFMCETCEGLTVINGDDCPACEGTGIQNDDYFPSEARAQHRAAAE